MALNGLAMIDDFDGLRDRYSGESLGEAIWTTDNSGSISEQTYTQQPIITNTSRDIKIEDLFSQPVLDLTYTNNELQKIDDRVTKLEDKVDKMIKNQEELIEMLSYLLDRKKKVENLQYGLRG